MYTVCLRKQESYADLSKLRNTVAGALQGIGKTSFSGKKILIKPNFLKPSSPEKAVTTHPLFLRALIEILKDGGAEIWMGDSPGFGTFNAVCSKIGLNSVLDSCGVKIADFTKTRRITVKESLRFKEFELPSVLFEMDSIINAPKLKTHQMMHMTMAVKNLYGCIPGMRKIRLHMTAGETPETFATLLLDLYSIISPEINIIDGIEGMEGNGPSSGIVRRFNIVAAGDNALALDFTLCRLLNIRTDDVPYLKIAAENRLPGTDEESVTIDNDFEGPVITRRIKPPKVFSSNFAIPAGLHAFAKRFLISYPYATSACTRCGICKNHCPARAIEMRGRAVIDRARCIRCYCCQELCESDAIRIGRSLFK